MESGQRYPAAWRDGGGPQTAGVVVLEPTSFRLDGRAAGRQLVESVPYSAIRMIGVARGAPERLGGPTLVVEREGKAPLLIRPHGIGMLHELRDALAVAASLD